MNWKLITSDKAPDYVLVIDLDNKRIIYSGTDLETAKLTAASPKLLEALMDLLNINHNDVDITHKLNAEHNAKEVIKSATV